MIYFRKFVVDSLYEYGPDGRLPLTPRSYITYGRYRDSLTWISEDIFAKSKRVYGNNNDSRIYTAKLNVSAMKTYFGR